MLSLDSNVKQLVFTRRSSLSPGHVEHMRIIEDTVSTFQTTFSSGEWIELDPTLFTIKVCNSLRDLRTQRKDCPAGFWITCVSDMNGACCQRGKSSKGKKKKGGKVVPDVSIIK